MKQTWVETSQYPCVILPNPVGRSDKVIDHSNIPLSSNCAWRIPLPYRWHSYLGNIQVTISVWNSSYQARKPVTLYVRDIVQFENEIWFLILPEARFGPRVLSLPVSVSVCPSVRQSRVCLRDNPSTLQLGSPNLDHKCKRPWLRSLLFWEWLTLTFKVKFNFKVTIYPILSLSVR